MTLNLKKRKEEERVAWRRVAKNEAQKGRKRGANSRVPFFVFRGLSQEIVQKCRGGESRDHEGKKR